MGSHHITLTDMELHDINEALSKITVVGDRYPVGSDYAKRAGK